MKDQFKRNLLDFNGVQTGIPLDRSHSIQILIGLIIFIICYQLPLEHISPNANQALALVATVVWYWVTNCVPLIVSTFILGAGGMMMGLFTSNEFQVSFGTSAFLVMVGMTIVSMGATRTNIARRIAFLFLYKLGKSPSLILLAISISTAVVSAFVSNLATTIVMASISIGILTEMEEVKGESGLGKALMLSIPVFSMIGGFAIMSGSPAMNMVGITTLESSTGGQYTITYSQWAVIGSICAILVSIPTWLIYKKVFKVTDVKASTVDPLSFKTSLQEMGALTGAEIRWLLTVALMIGSMLAGILSLPIASLLCGAITICPIIGTVKADDAMKSLPMDVLLLTGISPIIAVIFEKANISNWMAEAMSPLGALPPYLLMLTMALILACLNNFFANATSGIIALCVASFTPLVLALGLNPAIVLLPTIFMGAATTVLGGSSQYCVDQSVWILKYERSHLAWNAFSPYLVYNHYHSGLFCGTCHWHAHLFIGFRCELIFLLFFSCRTIQSDIINSNI